jgi:hypothetical protein
MNRSLNNEVIFDEIMNQSDARDAKKLGAQVAVGNER